MILFNGGPEDNEVLEKALADGEITDYPKEKFNIFSLPKEQVHTGGQFKTLQQQYEQSKVNLTNAKIAIVTHAYHWPRVGRYIGNKRNFDFLYRAGAFITAYLVDRNFQSPGVKNELIQEMQKMPQYIKKEFILPNICMDMKCNDGMEIKII